MPDVTGTRHRATRLRPGVWSVRRRGEPDREVELVFGGRPDARAAVARWDSKTALTLFSNSD
jgi:hypothetical protein